MDSLYDCTVPDADEQEECVQFNRYVATGGAGDKSYCLSVGCCFDDANSKCFQERVPLIPPCPSIITASDTSSQLRFDGKDGVIVGNSVPALGMDESFTIMANYDPHTHDESARLLFSTRVLNEVQLQMHAHSDSPYMHACIQTG